MIRLLESLRWKWWGVVCGIRHTRRYWRLAWRDNDCDYSYLLEFMELKLRGMIELHRTGDVRLLRWERTVRQMTICAALCRRLKEDNYFHNAGHDPATWDQIPAWKRQWIARHSTDMQTADAKYLGRMIGKHVLTWWH